MFRSIRAGVRRPLRPLLALAVAAFLAVAGVQTAASPARAATAQACDVYATGGTPCAAAYSTVHALFAAYNGPLYQIQRASDSSKTDIGVLSAGDYANGPAQVSFCTGTTCTITKIYDQTSHHNDMPISWGGFWKGPGPNGSDVGADAMALPVTVNGHQVFGVKVRPGVGYRIDSTVGVPTGSQPEGIYMVTSSNYYNSQCCFDFGSAETDHSDDGNATMNAIEWGNACWFGGCTGPGPWVEADLENGMYSTNRGPNNADNPGVSHPFVSAWEKNNGTSNFTLKNGDATTGGLTTTYSGGLPNGYSPMKVQPDVELGTGGDNSNGGQGEFFEGAVTTGFPSDATENAVQAAITATGYSAPPPPPGGAIHAVGAGKCLDVPNSSTTGGTQLQIYTCNGQSNQTFHRTSANEIQVTDAGTTMCLDANNKGTTAGTKVIIWSCNGQSNQQWNVNSNGTITGAQSGLCLDVSGASTANGALVQLWTCNGQSNQQWTIS
ncbi:MAG: alpha-L-arabinofuranosidase [Catenulispora sp.]|nr:alpha-L-arabinofuranosidase [Catenulispora sp.]